MRKEALSTDWFQYASGHQFFLHAHVMIQSFDSLNSSRSSTSGVIANMHRRLGVDADSQGVLICIGQCVYVPDVFKDAIGFVGFF